jgi:streptogramin lyase
VLKKLISVVTSTILALLAVGCATGPVAPPSAESGTALQGIVHGGQQAVVGAHVYLFAANTTGYGGKGIAASSSNASISLLNAASTGYSDSLGAYARTDSYGSFSITGDYTCTPGQQVYLYALGGNTGSGPNSAAGFLAVLGNCPAAGSFAASTPYVFMSEVSTVAAAYVMAPFATDALHVSSSGTALARTGIQNAFANAAQLVNIATGTALTTTPAGNGTVPQANINTLANILSTCVNSIDVHYGYVISNNCASLFTATAANSITPTDTATAAIQIAQNPGANIAAIYGLSPTAPPFQPALATQPNDFSLAIRFSGTYSSVVDMAIDAAGNVWFSNFGNSTLGELSSSGKVLSGSGYSGGGIASAAGIAIDTTGNVWVADETYSSPRISEFSSTGAAITSSSGYTGGGIDHSNGVVVDPEGNIWAENSGDTTLSKLTNSGTPVSPESGYSGGGLTSLSVDRFAADTSGNVWVSNFSANSISKLSGSGTPLSSNTGYTGGGLSSPFGPAIDSAGNVWVPNSGANRLSEFSSNGVAITTSSGYTGGGLDTPYSIAIDGAGNVWVPNYSNNSVSEFSNSGTAITGANGFTNSNLSRPEYIAIDGSGNIWLATGATNTNSISEIIGIASPVVTPIAANLVAPYSTPASKP